MKLRIEIDGRETTAVLPSINITKQIGGRYSSSSFDLEIQDVKDALATSVRNQSGKAKII